MRLIYFSPLPWSSFTQRPHEIVAYFHKVTGGKVLWIDPYPSRLPSWGDLFRPRAWSDNPAIPPGWLEVCTPLALPIDPLPFGARVNHHLFWQPLIKRLDHFITTGGHVFIGIGKPSALAIDMLRRFPEGGSFFDAMDDFPAFYGGLSKKAMTCWESQVLELVQQVFASSTHLLTRLSKLGARPTLVRNACAADQLPEPRPRTSSSVKTIGYIGTVGEWFNWDLTIKLAQAAPDSSVKIIGPIYHRPPSRLPHNITVEPACSHPQALEKMRSFDAGLIPFRRNRLTDSVDPIKYYEYRAMGLPVISTIFGEMAYRRSENGVFLLDDTCNFESTVYAACLYKDTADAITLFRRKNSWEERFASVALFHQDNPPISA